MTDLSWLSALTIGLFGSLHCFGMCGGIVNALSFAVDKQANPWQARGIQLAYHCGRLFTYSVIGALAGHLSGLLVGMLGTPGLFALRIVAGLLLIGMGLYVSEWWFGLTQLEKWGQHLWRHISPLTKRFIPVKRIGQALLLGCLWGWLPCGLVYSALALAIAQGSWQSSGLVMLCFGIGTLPAMLSLGYLSQHISQFTKVKRIRQFAGLSIILFGAWTMAMPFLHSKHRVASMGVQSSQSLPLHHH